MEVLSTAEEVADKIIAAVGKNVSLAIPLGAGKPNHIVNALYKKALADKSIHLKIFTALTLNKPSGSSFLEKRFLDPFVHRVFGEYPNLQYEVDRQKSALPHNIQVYEFYFSAGKSLNNRNSQENYISSNYTHIARDLADRNINVLAHLVAPDKQGSHISLSCNSDVTQDLIALLNEQEKRFVFAAQVNKNLPYMHGDAILDREKFDFILEGEDFSYPVFAPPKLSVPMQDHMIGLYASTLIKDGGELQVGIGSLGDALVDSLLFRHQNNELYQEVLEDLNILNRYKALLEKKGDTAPFTEGLFGATEMLVDGFMHLITAGILKRKVYDNIILQRLLNEKLIDEKVTRETLFHLLDRKAISPQLTLKDVNFLKHFGIFKNNIFLKGKDLVSDEGLLVEADLNVDSNFLEIIDVCLGDKLKNGAIAHAGFFLGCNDFYHWLRELPEEQREQIHMRTVTKINQLYGHEDLDRLHRKNARFVNTCMKMTLLGAAVSDGLEDGRVVSGVGGQYNFVAMAQALPDGYSILQLRSTRQEKGQLKSSIVFNYGHVTIPRHLRDIVITEYGIADLRGRTDNEVIQSLIEISDSRFQEDLIQQAKTAGKLEENYQLPDTAKYNFPEEIHSFVSRYKDKGLFKPFPFGTELTKDEIRLGKALKALKKRANSKIFMAKAILGSLGTNSIPEEFNSAIVRMGLDQPKNFKEKLYKKLIVDELKKNTHSL